MGTLFNQPVRQRVPVTEANLTNFIESLKKMAKQTGLSIDQIIKAAEIKEKERANDLYVSNGDIHDEQMAGIGELLNGINTNLERLAKAIEGKTSEE